MTKYHQLFLTIMMIYDPARPDISDLKRKNDQNIKYNENLGPSLQSEIKEIRRNSR